MSVFDAVINQVNEATSKVELPEVVTVVEFDTQSLIILAAVIIVMMVIIFLARRAILS